MEKVLRVLQIINQIVWIAVGLATLYSIYFFITHNPVDELIKRMPFIPMESNTNNSQPNYQSNTQLQKMVQQYLQNSK